MNTFAVIKTGGKQYKVVEGDTISVEKLGKDPDTKITFDQVLLISNGETVKVGSPLVAKALVLAKIVDNFKDKKIKVVKFKSKSRSLKTQGHRQQKTKVLIEKISS